MGEEGREGGTDGRSCFTKVTTCEGVITVDKANCSLSLSFASNCGRTQADLLIEGFVSWHKDTRKRRAFVDLDNSTRKMVISHFKA